MIEVNILDEQPLCVIPVRVAERLSRLRERPHVASGYVDSGIRRGSGRDERHLRNVGKLFKHIGTFRAEHADVRNGGGVRRRDHVARDAEQRTEQYARNARVRVALGLHHRDKLAARAAFERRVVNAVFEPFAHIGQR